ncbi:MAG: hypothetical protein IKP14_01035 [Clostridiales bacterium]|nr:hypothetical protein [Clostridiales bacterium]
MTFGILVYEKDEYLYTLIKERLASKFPTAYIERAGQTVSDSFKLIKQIHVLYDNRQYNAPPDSPVSVPVPLFSDDGKGHSIIDMRVISKAISGNLITDGSREHRTGTDRDRLRLLISYAYIDERETFIRHAVGPDSFDCLHPIRIDLMSGIRMPNTFTPEASGSISGLLRSCTDKKFAPVRILDYLNPDSNGFLSCGKPDNEDDVFDIGIDHSGRLMELLADLCTKEDTGALVVAEGWRVSELLRLIRWCDTLHILLPARMCTEDTGMTKELGHFKRALKSGALMTIDYCEDYRHQYDSINM